MKFKKTIISANKTFYCPHCHRVNSIVALYDKAFNLKRKFNDDNYKPINIEYECSNCGEKWKKVKYAGMYNGLEDEESLNVVFSDKTLQEMSDIEMMRYYQHRNEYYKKMRNAKHLRKYYSDYIIIAERKIDGETYIDLCERKEE